MDFDPFKPENVIPPKRSHDTSTKYTAPGKPRIITSNLRPQATTFVPRGAQLPKASIRHDPDQVGGKRPGSRIREIKTSTRRSLRQPHIQSIVQVSTPPSTASTPNSSPLSYRLPSPLLSPASSTCSEPLRRPISPLSLSSSLSSRNPSLTSLPDLSDSYETTPGTSYPSRSNSVASIRDDGIPVSTDADISRLFAFDFDNKPPESFIREELVDLAPEKAESDTEHQRVIKKGTRTKSDTDIGEDAIFPKLRSRKQGATLVSVVPIEKLLLEDSARPNLIESSKRPPTKTPLPIDPAPERKQIQAKPIGKKPKKENLLVDLSEEPTQDMKRMAANAVRSGVMVAQPLGKPAGRLSPKPKRHRDRAIDGDGQLVDVGIPVASSSSSPPRRLLAPDDPKYLRHRISSKTPRPSSPRNTPSPYQTRLNSAVFKDYQAISPYVQLLSRPSPRHTVPQHLRDPDGEDPLQQSLMLAWQKAEPSAKQKRNVAALLEKLSVVINERLGWPNSSSVKGQRRFEVDVFGSVSWGGETGESGDLDLVVLVSLQVRSQGMVLIVRIIR